MIFSGLRLEALLRDRVRRDGGNTTSVLVRRLTGSRFFPQLQLVMLQGIAMAGFNVLDLPELHRATGLPVLVLCRKPPDLAAIAKALLERVPGGKRKWRLIQAAPAIEPLAGLYGQRLGLSRQDAEAVIRDFAVHSLMPEPLRTAHLIASALAAKPSRHRV